MRIKPWVYVTFGTLAWLVPVAAAPIVSLETRGAISEQALEALGLQIMALLTYPVGVFGILAALPAFFWGS